jgi:hypothetical protein
MKQLKFRIVRATFKNESFTFIRNQGQNDHAEGIKGGVIYIHHFGTGYQELIFASNEKASKWWKKHCLSIAK